MDESSAEGPAPDRIADSDLEGRAMQAALEAKLFGTPMPQVRVGRFVVLERLGQGGMGLVYAVYDDKLDRRVALKLLKGDATDALSQRLEREAKTMARLSHPNVVPVFEVDEHDGQLFIVMEYVQGKTLRDWVEGEPRAVEDVIDKYVQAARGLAAAHAAGIVHRDFKPDNAIVGASGRVQVLDFGLARSHGESGRSSSSASDLSSPTLPTGQLETPLTESGSMVGTPAYMSPEQWHGEPPDHRTDQFAFCLSLWEALGGARPFTGTTRGELMLAVTEAKLVAPPKPIPSRVRRVLERGLSVEPTQRHDSMQAVIDALQATTGSPRWIRPVVITASVGGLVAATALSRQDDGGVGDPCVDGPAELAEVFDDERRAAIAEALARTEASFAEDTVARVDAELSEFTTEWLAGRRDACEATKVRGEQSEQVLAQRLDCLADRKRNLDAVVSVLEEIDRSTIANATMLARGLPSVERCSDLEYLSAAEPPLEDPEAEAKRLEILATLATADALEDAGRHADSERVAMDALKEARELDHPTSIVASASYVSHARFSLARRDEAAEAAREGYVLADAAAPSFAVKILLAYGHSILHTSRYDDAIAHYNRALALAEQRGLGVAFEGVALFRRGEAQRNKGELDEALASYRECLSRLEAAGHGSEVLAAKTREDIGSVLQIKGDYSDALAYTERAIEDLSNVLGPEHPHVTGAMVSTGILLWRLDRQDDAQALFKKALKLQKEIYGETHPMIATTQHNLALSLVSQGRYAEAIERYQQGLQIFAESLGPEHPNVSAAHDAIGLAYQHLGRYPEALEHHDKALEILRKAHGDDATATAGAEGHVAQALGGLGRHEEALEHLLHVLEIEKKELGTHRYVAADHNALAEAYSALGRYGKARDQADAALAVWAELDPENHRAGWSELARGFVDAEQGDCAAAVPRFERAVGLFDEGLTPDHADRARPSAALAICAHRAGLDGKVGPARAEVNRLADLDDAPASVGALAELVDTIVAEPADLTRLANAREGLVGLGLRPYEVLAGAALKARAP